MLPSQHMKFPMFQGNNYSATLPINTSLPNRPNPLVKAPAPQTVKADASGIQQAMAKRAAQDNAAKRQSSCGEASGVSYKKDDEGHLTSDSAFKSLDKYMKKAGLNSFQATFFGRLIAKGMNQAQLKQAVDQAAQQFGEKVASELRSGLEKIAVVQALIKYLAPAARALTTGVKAAPRMARPSYRITGKTLPVAADDVIDVPFRVRQPSPTFWQNARGQAANYFQPGRYSTRGGSGAGAITGVFNPFTGVPAAINEDGSVNWGQVALSAAGGAAGGRALSQFGSRGLQQAVGSAMSRANAGSTLGYLGGMGAQGLGYNVDPLTMARAGFVGGAALPGRVGLTPGAARNLPRSILGRSGTLDTARTLDRLDPGWQLFNAGGKGLNALAKSRVGQWAKANPATAAGLGLGTAATYGVYRAPEVLKDKILNSPEVQDRLQIADQLALQAHQTMNNVNQVAQPFAGISNLWSQNKDWLMPMLLSGGLGTGLGYMAGGSRGAAMGGIGGAMLPMLLNALAKRGGGAQQQANLASFEAPKIQAAETPADPASPAAAAPAQVAPMENEIARQQALQQGVKQ